MSSNLQRSRAAKAARRKQVVAAKRKLELSERHLPLRERMRRAAAGPIEHCVMQDGLFESGMSSVELVRRTGPGQYMMVSFLVDAFCLGVKDVMFREFDSEQFEVMLDVLDAAAPLVEIEPSYARKLIRDAVRYAESIGFAPHPDFTAVEGIFGDVRAEDCTETFIFGVDGKPHYVPGPTETRAQIRSRVNQLRQRFGDIGYGFPVPVDDEEILLSDPELVEG